MSSERQEAFNGLVDIQDSSVIHGMMVPLSKPSAQATNEFVDQRRWNVGGDHVFIQKPLLEVPDVAGRLPETINIKIHIEQVPQERLPRLSQMREPLDEGFRRRLEDFAEGLFIRRVCRISSEEVLFVHAGDFKLKTGSRKLTRLLPEPTPDTLLARRNGMKSPILGNDAVA
jgi:hypothetical protein